LISSFAPILLLSSISVINSPNNNLVKTYGSPITPEKILSKPLDVLVNAIKPAGMYKVRSRNIYELAKIFSDKEFVEEIIRKIKDADVEEARRILMELPGVGIKTADVVLSQYFGKPVFPIDTHIRRITKRLGYVKKNSYIEISRWWMENTSPQNYVELHLLLITHGRRICKARNPRCDICPLRDLCSYGKRNV
jgi:endonuclease-3